MSNFDNVATFPNPALWTVEQLLDLADRAYRANARATCANAIDAVYALFDKVED